jgi:hypothetical protein
MPSPWTPRTVAWYERANAAAWGEVARVLREFLAARLQRNGRGWLAPYRKRAAVVTWRRRTGGTHGSERGGRAGT